MPVNLTKVRTKMYQNKIATFKIRGVQRTELRKEKVNATKDK
jgi:hypothetical protein